MVLIGSPKCRLGLKHTMLHGSKRSCLCNGGGVEHICCARTTTKTVFVFCLLPICNSQEPVYQLMFKKKQSQEDFIRGHMSRHPYPSNEIGTAMRDVSSRICRDLDLVLDADFGLELLVDNKIINLDLSIALVYEQVRPRPCRSRYAPSTPVGSSASGPRCCSAAPASRHWQSVCSAPARLNG